MMNRARAILLRSLWTDPNYEVEQMSCPEIPITDISQALYATLLQDATSAGAVFDGEKATIEGCEFIWNYDAPSQTLHITCTKKPMLATCGEVKTRILALVEKSKASGGI